MRIVEQKSSGTWWKVLLGFLGGFVFALVALASAVAVAGGYMKTGDLLGSNADNILTEKYQEMTILDIVLDAVGGKIKIETLGDIADITPVVDIYVDNLSSQLNELGCALTKEEVFSWPLTKLSDNLIESVKQVELINFLSKGKVDNPDPVVKFLCYQTDADGNYVLDGEGNLIPIKLSAMIDDGSFVQNKVDTMKISVLFTPEEIAASKLLTAIQNKTVKQLSQDGAFNDIEIASVVGTTDSKIIKAFEREHITIGNISDGVNNLYLDDVFEYTDEKYNSFPSVLKKLIGKEGHGNFPGQLVDSNPYEITKMTFDGEGYPLEYDYVIFSDGTAEHKTDYIPFSKIVETVETGFIDKETISIHDDGSVTFSGHEDRGENDATVTINVTVDYPEGWNHELYVYSCNKPTKVKDLDNSIDSLQLKDVLKIKPTDSLWKVRNDKVKDGDQLFASIKNNLTLVDIMPDYVDYKFIKNIPGTTLIKDIGTEMNNIKLVAAFEENIYGTDGKMNSTWKYLLTENSETWVPGVVEKDNPANPFVIGNAGAYNCVTYTIGGDGVGTNPKGIGQLVENMKANMARATLYDLKNDNIIPTLEMSFLTKNIPVVLQPYAPAGKTTYGELTIEELTGMLNHL